MKKPSLHLRNPALKRAVSFAKLCVICNKEYFEYGNNAAPVKEGWCCDSCNRNKVIPARIHEMLGTKKQKKE